MIQDMTVGNPTRLIVKFALPLLIGNLFQQLYNLSDIIIVGHLLGINALAAVGATAPVFFVFLLIAFGFTGGLTVVTAQRFGAKDYKGLRSSVTHSLIASGILSVLIGASLMFFLKPLLRLMNVPAEIMEDAYTFMFILSGGMVMIVFFNLLSGFIRAVGDSKTPLYFLMLSSVLNICLNLFFIYVLKMGVAGSATGTVIAVSISVGCCLWFIGKKFSILHLTKADWQYDRRFMKEHLNIAIPMGIQFAVLSLGMLILQSVCNSFGPEVIAAMTAAMRVEQVATQPLLALGLAMATYAAQNWGAGKLHRIREGVRNSAIMALSFSLCIALLVRFVGEEMIGIFIEAGNDRVVRIACEYLDVSTLFYFFLGMIFVFRNTLQGIGRSGIPLAAGFTELFMRPFAAIWLAKEIGYPGLFYAGPIAWLGAGLVVTIGYWYTIRRFGNGCLRRYIRPTEKLPLPLAAPAE